MTAASGTVLVVEDEIKIAELLADYLRKAEFDVQQFHTGIGVVEWVTRHSPVLVLLDVMLPGVDGLSICRELRRSSSVPIMLVTARVEELDRLLGLDLGADDYICKPFSPREVVARARAVLRRGERLLNRADDEAYAGIRVDQEGYRAWLGQAVLDLTPVEFRLLQTLLRHPGRVFSRADLVGAVYLDHRVVTDRTVDTHVKNLRRKLSEADASGADLIESVYGVGYRLG
jgi:two-component system response regulator BaeR